MCRFGCSERSVRERSEADGGRSRDGMRIPYWPPQRPGSSVPLAPYALRPCCIVCPSRNRQGGRDSQVKGHVVKGLLVLVSVALVLLLAEVGLRLVSPTGALRGLYQPEPGSPWLYGLRPGAVSRLDPSADVAQDVTYAVNPDGYRGPVARLQKPVDTLRILVLGDSVAFGYGVEEESTFARRLESLVAGPPALEVLNFGVGGYNPYNEAALFRGKGAAYHPDIVLVQFCINDLNEPTAHFDAQTKLELGTIPDAAFPDPRERAAASSQAPCWSDPCSCSRICSAAAGALRLSLGSAPPLDIAALAPRELPPGPSRHWIGDRYQEIAAASEEIGARFAVVVFPYRDQVEGSASSRVQEQLSEIGRERGFEVIDLLPAFRGASSAEPLFLDLWHPTAAGHRVAADAIVNSLESLGWMPKRHPATL